MYRYQGRLRTVLFHGQNLEKLNELQMGKPNDMPLFYGPKDLKVFHRWDGEGNPNLPTMNANTGEIKN